MTRTDAQLTAHTLLDIEAIHIRPDEPFTFTSGRKSPVYVDCRKIISFPRARSMMMDMAVDLMARTVGPEAFDSVAGGETAGIPYAAFLAERLNLPMLYVRKKPKGFGRNARIEGDLHEGQRVLLVEDLATDGGSKLSFVEGLREAGAKVSHCFVIFHYGIFPEGIAKLKAEGISLHALATWADVLEAAADRGMSEDHLSEVRRFLSAPDDWTPKEG